MLNYFYCVTYGTSPTDFMKVPIFWLEMCRHKCLRFHRFMYMKTS